MNGVTLVMTPVLVTQPFVAVVVLSCWHAWVQIMLSNLSVCSKVTGPEERNIV